MKNMFDLSGRVALITGASSGLGFEYAKALAAQGADLALLARRENLLLQNKEQLEQMGAKVYIAKCDVTDEQQVERAVAGVMQNCGKIDILFNNAGCIMPKPTVETTKADWDKVVDVNLDGVFFVTKHVVKHMIAQNYGRIINICSMYGLRANTTGAMTSYYASKGAIPQLTRGWAQEFAGNGITVNAIAPGMFHTAMMEMVDYKSPEFALFLKTAIPMGRIGKLEELHGLAVFLASESCSYITGQTIAVDGGKTSI